ncbi:Fanconi anemia group I protein-like isoform X2 [Dysidea avara]|uniref:Fanconi anemia group I protein-like isoform X2 n=1 Tax=Dysidea avara TaxID=196820 RepID=UPI00332C6BF5
MAVTSKRTGLSPMKKKNTPVKNTPVLSPDQVVNKLESCRKANGDFLQVIEDILQDKLESYQTIKTLYTHCIEVLNMHKLTNQCVRDITGKLCIELASVPIRLLVELAELITDCVKWGKASNGRSIEFLPKILSLISMATTVPVRDDQMEGPECKSHLLDSLCSVRWPDSSVIHLAAAFREIVLSDKELRFVIEKILRTLEIVEVSDIAPLVYQLLLLATKGHKVLVLTGVTSFFNNKHQEPLTMSQQEGSMPDLFPTEGTVLLHISQAIKQNQELGKEFVKCLKAGVNCVSAIIMSPFSIALAMSMARMQRFEDQILDLMKSIVTRRLKDHEKWKSSKWIQEVISEVQDIKEVLLDTVRHSSHGWDMATPGLVQLGFYLMEATVKGGTSDGGVADQVCGLGSSMLQMVFKLHRVAQQEILSRLLNKIITGGTTPAVQYYFSLFHSILSSELQVVLDSLHQVKEAVSYLSLLPPPAASGLLQTLQPLVKISPSFRDSLLLVLRKSLFSRQPEARKSALTGYMQLLSSEGVASSVQPNWQLCSSQMPSSSSSSTSEALCYEILGVLRRCLSQQDTVRVALYEGLADIYQNSDNLQEPILTLLMGQFNHYYQPDKDTLPPVELGSCVTVSHGEATRVEPLDYLLQSIQSCVACSLHQSSPEDEMSDFVAHAKRVLNDLLDRMVRCEVDDFEIDQSADYSISHSVGMKNVMRCSIVAGVYETLLEYAFITGEKSMESSQHVLKMFRGYQIVTNILKEKGVIPGGSKKGASSKAHKAPHSMLSLKGLATMLTALLSDELPAHQPGLGLLRESNALRTYLLTTALQAVQTFAASGTTINQASSTSDAIATIGRCFYKLIGGRVLGPQSGQSKKDKGKPLVVMSLEGLSQLLTVMCSKGVDQLCHFLSSLDDVMRDSDQQAIIHHYIRHFQHYINSSVAGEATVLSSKEAQSLVTLIGTLSTKLDSSQRLEQVHSWVKSVCTEWNLENDIHLTKSLLHLMFVTSSRLSPDLPILHQLSQDVHYQLGDIEEDVVVDENKNFSIVTPRTSEGCVLAIIYQQTEQALEVVDWFISHLKAENSLRSLAVVDLTSLREVEGEEPIGMICDRLSQIVSVLHNMVRSADVPSKSRSQELFKCLQKFYGIVEQLTKHHYTLYCQSHLEIGDNFRQLIEQVGSKLSQQVYAYITYKESMEVQAEPQETRGKKKGKGTSKSGPGKSSVKRDLRCIPELIYAIEQFEKELIKLGKKIKENLLSHFKRSTARDFRIDGTTVNAILQGQADDEEGDSGSGGDNPKAKRLKLSIASDSPTD